MARMRPKYGKDAQGRRYLKYYYAEFYDPQRHPKRKRISLRTTDETAARQKFVQLEREYMAGLHNPWADATPEEGLFLSPAIRRYSKARRKQDLSSRTLRADRSVLDLFCASLAPGFLIAHVEKRHVQAFLSSLDLAASSYNTYLARLSGFFSWCCEQGLKKQPPTARIKQRNGSRASLHALAPFLNRDEFDRLLRTIEADAQLQGATLKAGEVVWLLDVVRFAVSTGMRLGEICHMRWRWINLHDGYVNIQMTKHFTPKWKRERSIPLAGDALSILRRLQPMCSTDDEYVFQGVSSRRGTRPHLNPEYVSKRFLHYRRMAKLSQDLSFHSLRHTFASWLVIAGVDLYRVKELLGHKSIETTMRYAHLAPHNLKHDVERVFGPSTQPPFPDTTISSR